MPIHLAQNQYHGVNAHLHSYFQQQRGWASFHTLHINDLFNAFQEKLPFSSGYSVDSDESIQVAHYDPVAEETRVRRYRPDVGVFRHGEQTLTAPSSSAAAPTMILPVTLYTAEADRIGTVKVYRLEGSSERLVTQVELISPTNTPGGSGWLDYQRKRDDIILAGVHLIEIQYLHERRSTVPGMPDYSRREENAFPYAISVTRLENEQDGETQVYGFRVDERLPVIAVPLDQGDNVEIDFGESYQQTYHRNERFAQILVDYDQPPLNFGSYDKEDQQRIHQVMARAKEAAAL